MLKQQLKQKLLQRLTPQQIQVIRLLEVPTIQLEQKIKKELEENPMLEEGIDDNFVDEFAELSNTTELETTEKKEEEEDGPSEFDENEEFGIEDYLSDDDEIPNYKLQTNNYDPNEKRTEVPLADGVSYHDYLESQLSLVNLSELEKDVAHYLIGNIDDDGYLRRSLQAILDDLAFKENIETSLSELEHILKEIHDLEPIGSGARDLQECLKLQLKKRDQSLPENQLALDIVENYFDEFTKKHYDKIISITGIAEKRLKEAIDIIIHLNPKPGSAFNDSFTRFSEQIMPDFILEQQDGDLVLSLNAKNVPELRINADYMDLVEGSLHKSANKLADKEAQTFVKQKISSARNFIDALRQRQITLMYTMNAIIEYQKEFFNTGDEACLKPMILKIIADETGLDISTISRVVNSKFIQTPYGVYSLKYFFSEKSQKDDGEEVSTREIKKLLAEMIGAESKKKPLTDDKLALMLKEKGYNVARRTVAKYREQLEIPVARLRKAF